MRWRCRLHARMTRKPVEAGFSFLTRDAEHAMPAFRPQPFAHDKFLSMQTRTVDRYTSAQSSIMHRWSELYDKLRGNNLHESKSPSTLAHRCSDSNDSQHGSGSSVSTTSEWYALPGTLSPALAEELDSIQSKAEKLRHHQGFVLSDALVYNAFCYHVRCGAYREALEPWLHSYVMCEGRGPPYPLCVLQGMQEILRHGVLSQLPCSTASVALQPIQPASSRAHRRGLCELPSRDDRRGSDREDGNESAECAEDDADGECIDDGDGAPQHQSNEHCACVPTHSSSCLSSLDSYERYVEMGVFARHIFAQYFAPVWRVAVQMQLLTLNPNRSDRAESTSSGASSSCTTSAERHEAGETASECADFDEDESPARSAEMYSSRVSEQRAGQTRRRAIGHTLVPARTQACAVARVQTTFTTRQSLVQTTVRGESNDELTVMESVLNFYLLLAQCAAETKQLPLLLVLHQTFAQLFLTSDDHNTTKGSSTHSNSAQNEGNNVVAVGVTQEDGTIHAASGAFRKAQHGREGSTENSCPARESEADAETREAAARLPLCTHIPSVTPRVRLSEDVWCAHIPPHAQLTARTMLYTFADSFLATVYFGRQAALADAELSGVYELHCLLALAKLTYTCSRPDRWMHCMMHMMRMITTTTPSLSSSLSSLPMRTVGSGAAERLCARWQCRHLAQVYPTCATVPSAAAASSSLVTSAESLSSLSHAGSHHRAFPSAGSPDSESPDAMTARREVAAQLMAHAQRLRHGLADSVWPSCVESELGWTGVMSCTDDLLRTSSSSSVSPPALPHSRVSHTKSETSSCAPDSHANACSNRQDCEHTQAHRDDVHARATSTRDTPRTQTTQAASPCEVCRSFPESRLYWSCATHDATRLLSVLHEACHVDSSACASDDDVEELQEQSRRRGEELWAVYEAVRCRRGMTEDGLSLAASRSTAGGGEESGSGTGDEVSGAESQTSDAHAHVHTTHNARSRTVSHVRNEEARADGDDDNNGASDAGENECMDGGGCLSTRPTAVQEAAGRCCDTTPSAHTRSSRSVCDKDTQETRWRAYMTFAESRLREMLCNAQVICEQHVGSSSTNSTGVPVQQVQQCVEGMIAVLVRYVAVRQMQLLAPLWSDVQLRSNSTDGTSNRDEDGGSCATQSNADDAQEDECSAEYFNERDEMSATLNDTDWVGSESRMRDEADSWPDAPTHGADGEEASEESPTAVGDTGRAVTAGPTQADEWQCDRAMTCLHSIFTVPQQQQQEPPSPSCSPAASRTACVPDIISRTGNLLHLLKHNSSSSHIHHGYTQCRTNSNTCTEHAQGDWWTRYEQHQWDVMYRVCEVLHAFARCDATATSTNAWTSPGCRESARWHTFLTPYAVASLALLLADTPVTLWPGISMPRSQTAHTTHTDTTAATVDDSEDRNYVAMQQYRAQLWEQVADVAAATAVSARAQSPALSHGNSIGVVALLLARESQWRACESVLRAMQSSTEVLTDDEDTVPDDTTTAVAVDEHVSPCEDGGSGGGEEEKDAKVAKAYGETVSSATMEPSFLVEIFRRAQFAGAANVCAMLRLWRGSLFF